MSSRMWELFHQMDDYISPLQRRFAGLKSSASASHESIEMIWAPPLDVADIPQGYLVRTRMPGLANDEVRVMVDNGVVTFSGERKMEGRAFRPAAARCTFVRSFSLPDGIDDGSVAAQFKDGVLSVRLPRGMVRKPGEVEVARH